MTRSTSTSQVGDGQGGDFDGAGEWTPNPEGEAGDDETQLVAGGPPGGLAVGLACSPFPLRKGGVIGAPTNGAPAGDGVLGSASGALKNGRRVRQSYKRVASQLPIGPA